MACPELDFAFRRPPRLLLGKMLLILGLATAGAADSAAAYEAGTRPVSAGGYHACRIRIDGTLACWGLDDQGQASPPTGTFRAVSTGEYHSCGIRSDETLACWGRNYNGQASPPTGTFSAIESGHHHACAVRTDGTLACWGLDNLGQASPPGGAFSAISAGYYHSCGVRTDGTLACWGTNYYQQPMTPPSGTFIAVSALAYYGCGIRSDGTLACWGGGTFFDPPGGTFSAVSAGWYHVCALRTDGTLACWGNQDYGAAIPPSGTFSDVSPGFANTCAVRGDDTLTCWGNDNFGQAPQLELRPLTLAEASTSAAYSQSFGLADSSGTASPGYPYIPPTPGFAVVSGTLPPGLDLASSGLLSGTPTTAGSFSFTVEGEDANGFTARRSYLLSTISAGYGFVGFDPPIDNPPAVNFANAGRTVPFKWRLVDAAGSPVTSLEGVTLRAISMSCDGSAVVDEVEQYVSAGTGFINHGNGDYQYNWQSPANYRETCRKLVLDLGDGSAHEALFRFH